MHIQVKIEVHIEVKIEVHIDVKIEVRIQVKISANRLMRTLTHIPTTFFIQSWRTVHVRPYKQRMVHRLVLMTDDNTQGFHLGAKPATAQ